MLLLDRAVIYITGISICACVLYLELRKGMGTLFCLNRRTIFFMFFILHIFSHFFFRKTLAFKMGLKSAK